MRGLFLFQEVGCMGLPRQRLEGEYLNEEEESLLA